MTRRRGELPELEEQLLGIERPSIEQEEAAEQVQKEKRELRKAFLRSLIENELFREWMMEKLTAFHTFEQPFGAGPTGFPDPLATHFALGMKAAGWSLWTEFDDLYPDLASLMRREALGERN